MLLFEEKGHSENYSHLKIQMEMFLEEV
ncbi:hypothetical protein RSC2_01428 [Bacillus paralicheniformis]|nr:hypothetical protein RSC1_03973 [Bacillus paralicheniformis]BCE09632.1 hypothetical protein RSC2_01428 [Bacillus paralicheniformis]BCE15799.1 hypothetical protein RSC3_03155 [Bacillus paralicheniformis]